MQMAAKAGCWISYCSPVPPHAIKGYDITPGSRADVCQKYNNLASTCNVELCYQVLPYSLCCEVAIYKSKELTEWVLCADPLTLLMVGCEQASVVCPQEVGVLVHLRQTRYH